MPFRRILRCRHQYFFNVCARHLLCGTCLPQPTGGTMGFPWFGGGRYMHNILLISGVRAAICYLAGSKAQTCAGRSRRG
jgi:hypothetical protein